MKIVIEGDEIAEYYDDLRIAAEAIFVSMEDFEKCVKEALPETWKKPFMIAGEAVLMLLSNLMWVAEKMDFHVNRRRRTAAEGGFWVAKLEPWNPPKGDILDRGKRLRGSYGSKE